MITAGMGRGGCTRRKGLTGNADEWIGLGASDRERLIKHNPQIFSLSNCVVLKEAVWGG